MTKSKMILAKQVSQAKEFVPHVPVPIALSKLRFDEQNPRLAGEDFSSRTSDVLRLLWKEMSVDEVAYSIAKNGYFENEPLYVVLEKGKYTVVEGNRRLAAIMLLVDADARKKVGATDLPEATVAEKKRLSEGVPCVIYDRREELWQYLGFRHINGPKPWDAFSKAQYVAKVHEEYHVDLDEIAESIGDRHWFVKRIYRGLKVLEQAEKKKLFDRSDRVKNRFAFSHLYTALDYAEFQKLLKLNEDQSLKPNPVEASRYPELKLVMQWLYGSKSRDIEPLVKSQNPDLNILREVIAKPQGVSALRSGLSLSQASDIARGDKRRFQDAITRAKEELLQARATVTTGATKDELQKQIVEDIYKLAKSIYDEIFK
jgi:hypothetical protein